MSDVAESRQERKERTRQAILDAALELSEETGLGGLSLRAIAKRVGIVPTAFYRHFDSIEQLGLALVDTSFASLRQMMRQARREWTDIDAVITQSVSILARNVHERPEYFTFMFRERMSGIESVRAAIRHELELLERELATDLARLPGPGGLVERGPPGPVEPHRRDDGQHHRGDPHRAAPRGREGRAPHRRAADPAHDHRRRQLAVAPPA